MARTRRVKLSSAGILEVMKSQKVQDEIRGRMDDVKRIVDGQGIRVGALQGGGHIAIPVKAEMSLTDRAHGSVTLAHPAGEAVQAKYGALTKAAAQAGLEIEQVKLMYTTKSGKKRLATQAQIDSWTRGR